MYGKTIYCLHCFTKTGKCLHVKLGLHAVLVNSLEKLFHSLDSVNYTPSFCTCIICGDIQSVAVFIEIHGKCSTVFSETVCSITGIKNIMYFDKPNLTI